MSLKGRLSQLATLLMAGGLSLLLATLLRSAVQAGPAALQAAPSAPASQPITATVPIPNGKPTAVEVYHAADKWYVADGAQGVLLAYDGATLQPQATIPISRNVFPDSLIVDETYGRAYAASEAAFNSEFGEGSGLIYAISTITDTLLSAFDPSSFMSTLDFTLAHDSERHRAYLHGRGGLAYIDIAANTLITVALSGDINPAFFLLDEMAVNETTNTLYMLQNSYIYERLWILEVGAGAWSYVDFPSLGARDPQHLAISEAYNKVIVKVVQMPGNNLPGLFVLNRNDDSFAFIGVGDYGPMVVNEASGRLYTGVEVDNQMAIVDLASNSLTSLAMEGATTGVGVHSATDHAFLANSAFIALVDGASRTALKIPLADEPAFGLVVQDVAVNQTTGWAYAIPDSHLPQVIVIQDLPAGPLQWLIDLPLVIRR